ncbi:hypothetical protein BpHYR1_016146 [Brachionus plicatilis]|uniref:Uncharacterized protein n=1 Tax=Brachionus plicatilis TaxID=10195 RepID=A0A3M7RPM6_BRAPC|nr:hypothetical protein BpHYR1_016146 [Brachionus plicatilis]
MCHPVKQNPFGEEGETGDEIKSDNNCTITSEQNNPTHSPLSVNINSVRNETNNFQPSSGSSIKREIDDFLFFSAPMSNNSAEFNPFGNEEEEITEVQ